MTADNGDSRATESQAWDCVTIGYTAGTTKLQNVEAMMEGLLGVAPGITG